MQSSALRKMCHQLYRFGPKSVFEISSSGMAVWTGSSGKGITILFEHNNNFFKAEDQTIKGIYIEQPQVTLKRRYLNKLLYQCLKPKDIKLVELKFPIENKSLIIKYKQHHMSITYYINYEQSNTITMSQDDEKEKI